MRWRMRGGGGGGGGGAIVAERTTCQGDKFCPRPLPSFVCGCPGQRRGGFFFVFFCLWVGCESIVEDEKRGTDKGVAGRDR